MDENSTRKGEAAERLHRLSANHEARCKQIMELKMKAKNIQAALDSVKIESAEKIELAKLRMDLATQELELEVIIGRSGEETSKIHQLSNDINGVKEFMAEIDQTIMMIMEGINSANRRLDCHCNAATEVTCTRHERYLMGQEDLASHKVEIYEVMRQMKEQCLGASRQALEDIRQEKYEASNLLCALEKEYSDLKARFSAGEL